MNAAAGPDSHTYPMAPLIRLPLIGLYLALVLPLPFQAPRGLRGWLMRPQLPLPGWRSVQISSLRCIHSRVSHPGRTGSQ